MNNANSNVPSWTQRLAAELKRDKKRTAILTALVVVAGIVGGRLIVKQMTPAAARAAMGSTGLAPAPVAQAPRDARPAGLLAEEGAETVRPDKYMEQIGRNIRRDIFKPNTDFFPPEKLMPVVVHEPNVQTTQPAEDEKEMERQVILAQGRAMVLQSTMTSTPPTAVINGRVLRVGDWFNGFQVMEIASRTCTVEKKGVRLTLEMKLDE